KLVIRFGLTEREPVFDCEVLALDVAKIAEPGAQRLNQIGETGGREIAKTHHLCCLLRARRQRPRRCAANERDELAPLHYPITSSARASRARRLVAPLPDRLNDHTLSDRRHRIGVPEFVPRERERSFLISPVKIRKRAALHVSDQGMI